MEEDRAITREPGETSSRQCSQKREDRRPTDSVGVRPKIPRIDQLAGGAGSQRMILAAGLRR